MRSIIAKIELELMVLEVVKADLVTRKSNLYYYPVSWKPFMLFKAQGTDISHPTESCASSEPLALEFSQQNSKIVNIKLGTGGIQQTDLI